MSEYAEIANAPRIQKGWNRSPEAMCSGLEAPRPCTLSTEAKSENILVIHPRRLQPLMTLQGRKRQMYCTGRCASLRTSDRQRDLFRLATKEHRIQWHPGLFQPLGHRRTANWRGILLAVPSRLIVYPRVASPSENHPPLTCSASATPTAARELIPLAPALFDQRVVDVGANGQDHGVSQATSHSE